MAAPPVRDVPIERAVSPDRSILASVVLLAQRQERSPSQHPRFRLPHVPGFPWSPRAGSPRQGPTGNLVPTRALALGVHPVGALFRWALINTLHHRTGVAPSASDFGLLAQKLAVYQVLVEQHYRYCQFYANMIVAIVATCLARLTALGSPTYRWGRIDTGVLLTLGALFLGSRDTLAKYYARADALLVSPSVSFRQAWKTFAARRPGWFRGPNGRHVLAAGWDTSWGWSVSWWASNRRLVGRLRTETTGVGRIGDALF